MNTPNRLDQTSLLNKAAHARRVFISLKTTNPKGAACALTLYKNFLTSARSWRVFDEGL